MSQQHRVEASVSTSGFLNADRAADEVLTNFGGSENTGRWLRLMCDLEHEPDSFPTDAPDETSDVTVATAASLTDPSGIGNGAPAAFSAGASSEAA